MSLPYFLCIFREPPHLDLEGLFKRHFTMVTFLQGVLYLELLKTKFILFFSVRTMNIPIYRGKLNGNGLSSQR